MSGQLDTIFRHPIKGIGSETLQTVALTPTGAVDGDRAWALLAQNAEADTDAWQPRRNFLQVASGPLLAAVRAEMQTDTIKLTHPQREPLTFDPATEAEALMDWAAPLWPEGRPGPLRLVRAPEQGMTDVPFPSVSIGNLSTLRALSQKIGRAMDMRRFRLNLWFDGLAPFEEIDLLQGEIRIGSVILEPVEPVERCRAPDANPDTGNRDVTMLGELERGWGTRDFGVYFKVREAGTVSVGDTLERL